MESLRVSTVQSNLVWEDIEANLSQFAPKIASLKGRTDVVVLPEMFTTGFTNNRTELAEPADGKTFQWMYQQSTAINAVITGSYIVEEAGKYYNRLIWMQPNGQYAAYNKHYLFTKAKEDAYYERGQERILIDWKGWKICPLICYDLRFPMWARNTVGYDLLLYVANWPVMRATHWKALLMARAIENQAFTIGVNRTGVDGNDLYYSGDTSVIDYSGGVVYQTAHAEDIFTVALNYKAQQEYRKKLCFLPDQEAYDGPSLKNEE